MTRYNRPGPEPLAIAAVVALLRERKPSIAAYLDIGLGLTDIWVRVYGHELGFMLVDDGSTIPAMDFTGQTDTGPLAEALAAYSPPPYMTDPWGTAAEKEAWISAAADRVATVAESAEEVLRADYERHMEIGSRVTNGEIVAEVVAPPFDGPAARMIRLRVADFMWDERVTGWWAATPDAVLTTRIPDQVPNSDALEKEHSAWCDVPALHGHKACPLMGWDDEGAFFKPIAPPEPNPWS